MSNTIAIDTSNFEQEVLTSAEPVVIDFWAPWCGPCRAIGPVLENLADEYAGRVKVAKVNTDEVPELAQAFRIRGIPTLVAMVRGEVVDEMVGFRGKQQLEAAFATLADMGPSPEADVA